MKRTAILTVILLAALSLSGFAQEANQPRPKLKFIATLMSMHGTLIPMAGGATIILLAPSEHDKQKVCRAVGMSVGAVGVVLGPGLGHLYAGEKGLFKNGSKLRAVLLGAGFAGAHWHIRKCDDENRDTFRFTWASCLFLASGTLCVWSIVDDIVSASESVHKYNRRHGFVENIQLLPTYLPDNNAVGLALMAKF